MTDNIDIDAAIVKPEDSDGTTNTRPWKTFVDLINGHWSKSAGDFIECGQLIIEAKQELASDAFAVMIKTKLHFDASVAKKLICIAKNSTLGAHVHRLPPCWSTLCAADHTTSAASPSPGGATT
jgi:hypothetical protein